MLQSKLAYLLGDDQIEEYRIWLALVPHFMQGLPVIEAALNESRFLATHGIHEPEDLVNDFLVAYRFKTPKDEEGSDGSGLSPLLHAAMVENVEVAAALLAQGADVHCKVRRFNTTTGFDIGCTALHLAVALCGDRAAEMVALLLRAGANVNAPSKSGTTPLMVGTVLHNAMGVKAFLEVAKDTIDLERGININHSTALTLAAYMGTPELCEILIKAGANRKHIQDHGATKLHDACLNEATTKSMLDLLWNEGELDVNARSTPRNAFWSIIDLFFQTAIKSGLINKSQFSMEMAHAEGNTPLHYAASAGLLDVSEWLLDHGAHTSLRMRNKMGATPLDIARLFGPYPAIEAKLGSAMLNHQFGMQYAIRRGSLLRKQTGVAIEPKLEPEIEPEMDHDAQPSDEHRPAELTRVETIGKHRESDSTSGGATAAEDTKGSTHTGPSVTSGSTTSETVATIDVGTALAMLSSGVEARFDEQTARFDQQTARLIDEQTARFDEQATRFDEQAARLNALQAENAKLRVQNTTIMGKLDVILSKEQGRA